MRLCWGIILTLSQVIVPNAKSGFSRQWTFTESKSFLTSIINNSMSKYSRSKLSNNFCCRFFNALQKMRVLLRQMFISIVPPPIILVSRKFCNIHMSCTGIKFAQLYLYHFFVLWHEYTTSIVSALHLWLTVILNLKWKLLQTLLFWYYITELRIVQIWLMDPFLSKKKQAQRSHFWIFPRKEHLTTGCRVSNLLWPENPA